MYNTTFQVKYYDIERELIQKINDSTVDCDYSHQDVLLICNKLYQDEVSSVFYATNIFDNKMDLGMHTVLETLQENSNFKSVLEEIQMKWGFWQLANISSLDSDKLQNFKDNSNFMIMLTLFSYDIFFITHKIIVQQITTGQISSDLLDELKRHTITILTNNKN